MDFATSKKFRNNSLNLQEDLALAYREFGHEVEGLQYNVRHTVGKQTQRIQNGFKQVYSVFDVSSRVARHPITAMAIAMVCGVGLGGKSMLQAGARKTTTWGTIRNALGRLFFSSSHLKASNSHSTVLPRSVLFSTIEVFTPIIMQSVISYLRQRNRVPS